MSPFFSVIIPTYNQDKFLLNSLDALKKQTFKDFETIIIDNYSKDNTERVAKLFKKKKIYKKIKNFGVIAKSRNIGIKLSRGKWLAFLDTDDFWTHNKLEEVYDEIKKNKFDAFCNSEWILDEKTSRKKLWIYGHYAKSNFYKKLLSFGNCLSTSATVVNKNFLEKKKIYFNENKKFVTSEDYEFFLNIAINGGKFHFYNEPLGYHTFHEKSASANRKKHIQSALEVKKFHIFHRQNFTSQKKDLWNKVKKINLIQEKIKNLIKNKNFKFINVLDIFSIIIFDPLKFIQIIYLFFKKNFLQRIYFLKNVISLD